MILEEPKRTIGWLCASALPKRFASRAAILTIAAALTACQSTRTSNDLEEERRERNRRYEAEAQQRREELEERRENERREKEAEAQRQVSIFDSKIERLSDGTIQWAEFRIRNSSPFSISDIYLNLCIYDQRGKIDERRIIVSETVHAGSTQHFSQQTFMFGIPPDFTYTLNITKIDFNP